MNAYRVATKEEKDKKDVQEDYDLLLGPDGFECLLTELEDRRWYRDGRDAVNELNRLYEMIGEKDDIRDSQV